MRWLHFQGKIAVVVSGYGFLLVLFYGSILVNSAIHGDLMLIKGAQHIRYILPDIALLVHLSVGLFIMLGPLQRKIFGVLSTMFAFVAFLPVIYFNVSEAVLGLGGLIFGLTLVCVLLVIPSLYLLFAPSPHNGEGDYFNKNHTPEPWSTYQ